MVLSDRPPFSLDHLHTPTHHCAQRSFTLQKAVRSRSLVVGSAEIPLCGLGCPRLAHGSSLAAVMVLDFRASQEALTSVVKEPAISPKTETLPHRVLEIGLPPSLH